jgi:hypothetical protein
MGSSSRCSGASRRSVFSSCDGRCASTIANGTSPGESSRSIGMNTSWIGRVMPSPTKELLGKLGGGLPGF